MEQFGEQSLRSKNASYNAALVQITVIKKKKKKKKPYYQIWILMPWMY